MPIPDKQLVAFAGEPNGKITLVDWRQQPNHRVLRNAGDFTPLSWAVGDIDADPAQWQDALKVSGCVNLTVHAGTVRGGSEDVLDIMRSHHCSIFIENAYPRGKYVLTCKGESDDITVTVRHQHGHGKEVDYDLGNKADKDNGTTKNVRISANAGGETMSVRVLRADKPQLDGGPFKWAFPSPNAWYHGIVVWLLNIFS